MQVETDYSARIDALDQNDDASFQQLLNEILADEETSTIDLCQAFGINLETAARWVDGRSAPAPELRHSILGDLCGAHALMTHA